MPVRYSHRQIGYPTLVSIAMSVIALFIATALRDPAGAAPQWIRVLIGSVIAVLVLALLMFSTLTVEIDHEFLKAIFGPVRLVRKKINLGDIESCAAVRNPWYYGWGLRYTPHGWMYNVSGFHAVEVRMKNGSKVRIGTDVPEELQRRISETIG